MFLLTSGGEKMTSEYLITVVTGNRKGAGTDASVSLVMKGNAKYNFGFKQDINFRKNIKPGGC